MTELLRLGTRQSQLALTQSQMFADSLAARHEGLHVELVPIVTRGDKEKGELAKIGGKGLFTQELEEGLLSGDLDLAVHSLKDLPVVLPDGLLVAAYPEREDPRDGLVSLQGTGLDDLPGGAVVLTGSQRRQAQILARRDDLTDEGIRGHVETRLRKWREQAAGGVILAMAGLRRLGLVEEVPVHALDPAIMIPAPGQGTLAIEVKAGGRAEEYVRALDHPPSALAAVAERRVVAAFGGDCTLPLAAWASVDDDEVLHLRACLSTPDGVRMARGEGRGSDAEQAAEQCLEALRQAGAADVLAALGR